MLACPLLGGSNMNRHRAPVSVLLVAGGVALSLLACAREGCECGERWSIDCYCSVFDCQSFEEVSENRERACESDTDGLEPPRIRRGCGLIEARWGGDYGSSNYVFKEDDHELVGASSSTSDDSPLCGLPSIAAGKSLDDCRFVWADLQCP
jgi:hypothetical protein